MGSDLPGLCVHRPGLRVAQSALCKDGDAPGEWGKGGGWQDHSSEQAHPQETTLLRFPPFMVQNPSKQIKLPCRLGLQLHPFGLYYKSYQEKWPPQQLELSGKTIQVEVTAARAASSSPQRDLTRGQWLQVLCVILQTSWEPKTG